MNAVVEAYLRAYVQWDQNNWVKFLMMAMIAIRGRQASSTGVSPFFLQNGNHVDPIELHSPSLTQEYSISEKDQKKTAEAIIEKL